MSKHKMTRRQFLKGSGGAMLSLPFLPSLFAREVFAAGEENVSTVEKCFFALGTEHGAVRDVDMFGRKLSYSSTPDSGLSSYQFLAAGNDPDSGKTYPAHKFHYGNLRDYKETADEASHPDDPDGGIERLSYVLGSRFNTLLDKMNLLRGIDLHHMEIGHTSGYNLGNFASAQNSIFTDNVQTIDQIMAYSDKFYHSMQGVTQRSAAIGTGVSLSYRSDGSQVPVLGLDITTAENNPKTSDVFKKLFPGASAGAPDTLLIDKVLEHYRSFISPTTSTGKRIGKKDKLDLERFIDSMDEVQRKLNTNNSCSPSGTQSAYDMRISRNNFPYQEMIWTELARIMALAFTCGACRIFTARAGERYLTRTDLDNGSSDYHQNIAHQLDTRSSDAAKKHRIFHRAAAKEVFYTVIATLESYAGEVSGTTMLDQSLCTWQAESGVLTHNPVNMWAVTAGSAGGFFNTGRFIDFRSLNNLSLHQNFKDWGMRPGISQNQYLGNILLSMGIPRTAFENVTRFKGPGYGHWLRQTSASYNAGHIGFPQTLIDKSGGKIPVWAKI